MICLFKRTIKFFLVTIDSLVYYNGEFFTTENIRNLPKWQVKSTREEE